MNITEATLFWGFLLAYGMIMYVLSPKSRNRFIRAQTTMGIRWGSGR